MSRRLRHVSMVVGLVAGLAACSSPVSSDDVAATGDPVEGRRLFENNCAQCHGVDLQGTDQGPSFLDPVYEPGHHADVAFQRAVANGAPQHHWDFGAMPQVEGVTPADVTDIVAWVREQQRAAGIE